MKVVKVFTATRASDREDLGARITTWMRANPGLEISSTVVVQSSDRSYHCLTIVLFGDNPRVSDNNNDEHGRRASAQTRRS